MHPQIIRSEPGSCPICGMALEPRSGAVEEHNPELRNMTRRFWLAVAFTIPLLALAMTEYVPAIERLLPGRLRVFLELALATPVCVWAAWPFYVRAVLSVKNKSLNMFTLIGLGVFVAYAYSIDAAVLPGIFPASFRGPSGEVSLATLERGSEHPLAAAIVRGTEDRGIALGQTSGFESLTGKGVRGTVDGRAVALGSLSLMTQLGIDAGDLAGRAEALRADGQTVFLVVDGRPAGLLGVADPIKQSTPEAIRELHRQGIRIVMLTGDSATTARAVARKLELDDVVAEVLPDQKADAVKRLQKEGRFVAMAGDGINDAPALAQAQVGIAMGTGTDIAVESASVTLVKGDLRGIVRARHLSRRTMQNIRQNLFFAFIYNTAGVPIAAGVLYPFFGLLLSPIIAAAAMSLSSVSVITNALSLRRAVV